MLHCARHDNIHDVFQYPFLTRLQQWMLSTFSTRLKLGCGKSCKAQTALFQSISVILGWKMDIIFINCGTQPSFFIIALIPTVLLLVMDFFFRKLCMFFKMLALAHRRYLHCQVTLKTCSKPLRSSVLCICCTLMIRTFFIFPAWQLALHHNNPRFDRLGQCFLPYLGISNQVWSFNMLHMFANCIYC